MMVWAYVVSQATGTVGCLGAFGPPGSPYVFNELALKVVTGPIYNLFIYSGAGASAFTGTTSLSLSTWYHAAMTCAGTSAGQLLGYLNGALEISNGQSGAVQTSAAVSFGAVPDGDPLDGRLAGFKMWGAVLTASEIQQEMRSLAPVRTANLAMWSPLLASTALQDYTGTGTWTVNGSPTTEDGPPVIFQRHVRARRFRLLVTHHLSASLSAASVTPTATGGITRHLSATLAPVSTTPSAQASLTRHLTATLAPVSTTPSAQAMMSRHLLATLAGVSTTPAATASMGMAHHLTAALAVSSTTPGAQAQQTHHLTATLAVASVTPPATGSLAGAHFLTAALQAVSTTPAAPITLARHLAASLAVTSLTPAASPSQTRHLLATLAAVSQTPPALLGHGALFQAALQAVTQTPAATVLLTRHLRALLIGTTLTSPSTAESLHRLLAHLAAVSSTPAAFGSSQPPPVHVHVTPGRLYQATVGHAGTLHQLGAGTAGRLMEDAEESP
jgi:hypothetical protein